MTRRDAIALLPAPALAASLDAYFAGMRGAAVVIRIDGGRVVARYGADVQAEPGSLVKPIVLDGLMATGRLKETETLPCSRKLKIAGRKFACVHPAIAPVDAASALAYSCNEFVAKMAARFHPGELADVLRASGIALNGHVSKPAAGDESQLQAVGKFGMNATVLSVAAAYRKLAKSADAAVLRGLEGAVEFGTAQAAQVPGIAVAGKTGSASGAQAWFAGFAPSRAPQFVVAVLVQGYSGGADAAPIGGKLLNAAWGGKL